MDDDAALDHHLDAIADADPYPYWYDDADEPDSNPTLVRAESCDLCIIGGGYTGLWTAIIAKERDPSRDVVLIDAHEVGSAASGRNGGFMESQPHPRHRQRPGPLRRRDAAARGARAGEPRRDRIGDPSLRHRLRLRTHRRDRRRHPVPLADLHRRAARRLPPAALDWARTSNGSTPTAMRAQVDSPTYRGGLWRSNRAAIVDPARLVWGMKAAAMGLGVRIYEDTKATSIERDGVGVLVITPLDAGPCGQGCTCNERLQAVAAADPPLRRARSTTTAWSPSR